MPFQLLNQWLTDPARNPVLMGVLNVTPDSFSDGGLFVSVDQAVTHAKRMVDSGASIIDVGGESTRPGSIAVDSTEQARRVLPVISQIVNLGVQISIDTTSANVARQAIQAGATIVNDVSAGRDDPAMFDIVSQTGVAVVLMHRQGESRTMQHSPSYQNVVEDVYLFLEQRVQDAVVAGIARDKILLDVGIGFGKSVDHNLSLLKHHSRFADLGLPLVLGSSRKRFIGQVTGIEAADQRIFGTAATVAWGLTNQADVLRVHDVEAMRQVMSVIKAIQSAS